LKIEDFLRHHMIMTVKNWPALFAQNDSGSLAPAAIEFHKLFWNLNHVLDHVSFCEKPAMTIYIRHILCSFTSYILYFKFEIVK
jgi:hypothetical protein